MRTATIVMLLRGIDRPTPTLGLFSAGMHYWSSFAVPRDDTVHRSYLEDQVMCLYEDHILPHVINLAMRNRYLLPSRERTISAADGRVPEIGIGSCLNLPLYGTQVREVLGLEPAPRLLGMAQREASRTHLPTKLLQGSAESIPLEDSSIDTVVTTWTLCTVPEVLAALREMRRVLKPEGQLLFVEHGQSSEPRIRKWQDRLTPAWKYIGGGCHLNRPIRDLIERAGFAITQLDTGYMKGPKPMTFMYQGRARPAVD